ncbi:MAG: NAD-dependent epimerase/dehydratase family protein [Chloroflexota bacterium]
MNILILGGNGMMGPWVIKALEGRHRLRITDVNEAPDTPHEYRRLDSSDLDGVVDAAEGMDAIVNLSVLRPDRQVAFDVNTRGNYNMMAAATAHGIRRIVNTGPHFQLAGPTYEDWDFDLNPEMPPQPGTRLYALTKALGQEIIRVYAERHDIYAQTLLFYHLYRPDDLFNGPAGGPAGRRGPGEDLVPYSIAWPDAGEAIRCALELPLGKLPSRCETYFVFTDLPHSKFNNRKARTQLGWNPRYHLEPVWHKPYASGA